MTEVGGDYMGTHALQVVKRGEGPGGMKPNGCAGSGNGDGGGGYVAW